MATWNPDGALDADEIMRTGRADLHLSQGSP
jgi:hypothetical protein